MMLFMEAEIRFKKARHPLYVQIYENPTPNFRRHKRCALISEVMANDDDGALKLFAQVFEHFRLGALHCI
jgi:hypothetical protein